MSGQPTADQHTPGQSVLLHLGPGIVIGVCYFALRPLFQQWGMPSIAALMAAVAVVLIPIELGYLLYLARKRNGNFSLRGIVLYRDRIPVWQYFVWVPVLFVVVGVVFTVMKPVDAALQKSVFAWVPTLASGLSAGYSSTALIITYAMVAIFGAVIAPIVEEFYFRGYLLPRMGFAGKWAPALHSLLFALYHVFSPWQFVTRTIGMLPLAYAAQRRNVYIPTIVHVLVNMLDVVTAAVFIAAMRR